MTGGKTRQLVRALGFGGAVVIHVNLKTDWAASTVSTASYGLTVAAP
jgi:hypothetical protein